MLCTAHRHCWESFNFIFLCSCLVPEVKGPCAVCEIFLPLFFCGVLGVIRGERWEGGDEFGDCRVGFFLSLWFLGSPAIPWFQIVRIMSRVSVKLDI